MINFSFTENQSQFQPNLSTTTKNIEIGSFTTRPQNQANIKLTS